MAKALTTHRQVKLTDTDLMTVASVLKMAGIDDCSLLRCNCTPDEVLGLRFSTDDGELVTITKHRGNTGIGYLHAESDDDEFISSNRKKFADRLMQVI